LPREVFEDLAMSQPAKAQEPSMEEILASIRRIIADDDTSKPAPDTEPPAPQVVAPEPEPEMAQKDIDAVIAELASSKPEEVSEEPVPEPESEDVLELTESMTALPPEEEQPNFQTIDGHSDVVFSEVSSEPPPRAVEEPRRSYRQPSRNDRTLLSETTSAAVDSAFKTLAQTVLVHNARTLEDLVREMLRPMLKAWLDDNLPSMVERIVKEEIERVSRGRG
jgi:cell pole-organizing protein PopZ